MKINKYNRCTVKSWKQNQKKNYNRIKREKMKNENNQDKPKYLLENLDKSSIPLNNHFSGVFFLFRSLSLWSILDLFEHNGFKS